METPDLRGSAGRRHDQGLRRLHMSGQQEVGTAVPLSK
ncbi:hypothetical protein FH063_005611 [Azospirillum argentinense]|uniref:Uncharacterized protein n=1 Tax=Azospirillum argentinense TaxID=2970906 RepID=A0A5B0KS86_9PROT|nr:hypothetical protein FH063_005611 [Azospirillum argentinense]